MLEASRDRPLLPLHSIVRSPDTMLCLYLGASGKDNEARTEIEIEEPHSLTHSHVDLNRPPWLIRKMGEMVQGCTACLCSVFDASKAGTETEKHVDLLSSL